MEKNHDMPMGFVFQLALNEKAMENFSAMPEDEKRQVIDTARSVTSKVEMKGIVEDLARWN